MTARRVFITGIGRGIGAELAKAMAARGHTVWGSVRRPPPDDVAAAVAGTVTMDVADEGSITAGIADLADHLDSLDVLVNCAGIDARSAGADGDQRGTFDLDANQFNTVLNTNITGPMVVTREALPLLRAGTDALIVNISSQLGSMQFAVGAGSDTVYCVSKAGLNMLTVKTAATVQADGIAAVMIHPGWVQTDMGGPAASLTATESATAMADTIDRLTMADSGRFIRWDGTDHPW